jgi:glucoamylase
MAAKSSLALTAIGLSWLSMTAFAQDCQTVTLQSTVPTNANVSLQSYSYCGGTLNVTAYIAVSGTVRIS